MPLIGEAVVDGHIRILREFFDRRLCRSTELDGVVHAGKHARGVGR